MVNQYPAHVEICSEKEIITLAVRIIEIKDECYCFSCSLLLFYLDVLHFFLFDINCLM